MLVNTEIADCYQNLFNHLSSEHNLILTISEMDEIIKHCLNTVSSINSKTKLDQKIICHKRCGKTEPSNNEFNNICLNCGSSIIRLL